MIFILSDKFKIKMLPPELSELIIEKWIIDKWQGTALHNIPYTDYKIIQALNLYRFFELDTRFIERAVLNGDFHLIWWLYKTKHSAFNADLIISSASCGRIPLTNWLWKKLGNLPEHANLALSYASKYGHIPLIEWIFPKANEYWQAVQLAALNGHAQVLEWFDENCPREKWLSQEVLTISASNGRLYALKWLHQKFPEMCTHNVFDWAAGNGHHDIVEWLHQNCHHDRCSLVSILVATRKGNLRMVQWLYHNRPELEHSLDIVKQVAESFDCHEISRWIDSLT